MPEIILNEARLIENIREQVRSMAALKYKRSLLEFEDNDGKFLGDNVFETSFKMREDLPPLVYEVSGPYDVISNEYATIGRIYESGQRIFEADIKDQIQQRTAAMVWLYFSALKHRPENILIVGAGKLAAETARYLKRFMPELETLDYHARNQRPGGFETICSEMGVTARFKAELELAPYDTIIMVTNTTTPLIDSGNIGTAPDGAVIASLCTTSQTGEIAPDVYGREDINLLFDYDLTRSFTPDMRAAGKGGHLTKITYLKDLLEGAPPPNPTNKKNILRLTGTPMQNIAVLDMLRAGANSQK